MNRYRIVKFLALAIMIASVAVIIGWIFDITALKSVIASWPTMKFITATAFLFTGMVLYLMVSVVQGKHGIHELVISLLASLSLFIMGMLLFSAYLGIYTGIEDLFVREQANALTPLPGRPSIPGTVNFVLIDSICLLVPILRKNIQKYLVSLGLLVGIIGIIAAIGYVMDNPVLYYTTESINNGMALSTAILFVLLGFGFFMVGLRTEKGPNEN